MVDYKPEVAAGVTLPPGYRFGPKIIAIAHLRRLPARKAGAKKLSARRFGLKPIACRPNTPRPPRLPPRLPRPQPLRTSGKCRPAKSSTSRFNSPTPAEQRREISRHDRDRQSLLSRRHGHRERSAPAGDRGDQRGSQASSSVELPLGPSQLRPGPRRGGAFERTRRRAQSSSRRIYQLRPPRRRDPVRRLRQSNVRH